MEDVIFCKKVQDSIENKLNLRKGILQMKNGDWVGDIYVWSTGAWYYVKPKIHIQMVLVFFMMLMNMVILQIYRRF